MSAEALAALRGRWSGKLSIPTGQQLTLVLRFENANGGGAAAFLDSPDQGAKGIPVTEASFADGKLTVRVTPLRAELSGTVSGDTITGQWTQGGNGVPLTLKRE